MRAIRTLVVCGVLMAVALPVAPAELNCHGAPNVEDFRYTWRVRGAIGWLAGLVFPTSGVGTMKTTFPVAGQPHITSQLLITPTDGHGGFYVYESQMDTTAQTTLVSYHGYAWGKKSRKERTVFDYNSRVAQVHKETPEKAWDKTKPLPPQVGRDVLTAIYFLRENAAGIKAPISTVIYSDGDQYPVIFRPVGRRAFSFAGAQTNALGFEIVDAPGGKKWNGGVKVWLSEDARRIPFRIEINESVASMQLDLTSVESCGFMNHPSS